MAFIAGGSPRFSAKDPFWLNLTAFCWTWMQWTYAVMWVFIGVMWIALWYAEKITSVLSPRAVRALPWIGGLHLCSLATLFIYRGPFSPASYGIGTPLLGLSSVWLGWASWALLRALRRAGRRPEEVSEKPLSE
ncbi:hypothetical protein KJK32_46130 (plasmid) [Streptomyces sp. JCM17656]|nr:hypothetical protein KJK32_46130 [Streptomyces sp. JCM17656]